VYVIREDTDCDRLERMACLNGAVDLAETMDISDEQIARSVSEGNSKEEYATLDLGTAIPGHASRYHSVGNGVAPCICQGFRSRRCPPYACHALHCDHAIARAALCLAALGKQFGSLQFT
jgi:hypothetical protein